MRYALNRYTCLHGICKEVRKAATTDRKQTDYRLYSMQFTPFTEERYMEKP